MARTDNLTHFLTDVADAIRTKTGGSAAIAADDFDTEIVNIPSGGGTKHVEKNDVIFFDYDGTIVDSYSKTDFLNLSSFPSNPNHTGLTSLGWSWSLSDAKTFVRDNGQLEIGQNYVTSDNKTKIHIVLDAGRLSPYLGFSVNGTAQIDWGDNSQTTTVTGTGEAYADMVFTQHTYSNPGKYTISIQSENNVCIWGNYNGTLLLSFTGTKSDDNRNKAYRNAIVSVNCSDKTQLKNYAFYYCSCLESISLYDIAEMGNSVFVYCYSLKAVSLPSITSLQSATFSSCYSLEYVSLPSVETLKSGTMFNSCHSLEHIVLPMVTVLQSNNLKDCSTLRNASLPNMTTISGYAFNNDTAYRSVYFPNASIINGSAFEGCSAISNVTLPSVTRIDDSAFKNCYGVGFFDFSGVSAVPALNNTTAFSGISADCKIIVPDNLYNDWIAANNWSTYSSYIISKTDWDALHS